MRRGAWRHVASALVVGLVVVACAGDPPAPAESPSPSLAPSPTAAPTPSPSESPPPVATTTVEVFFSNVDRGDPCEDVFGVPREVPADAPLRGALEALLAGPVAEEVEAGYGGWFSAATADLLLDVRIEDGIALVAFDPRMPEVIPNASASCGSTALLASLDATVTQFAEVDEGRYGLDGDRVAFYGWLQRAAPGDEPPPDLPPPSDGPTDGPSEPEPAPSPSLPPDDPEDPDDPPASARAVPDSLVGTEWTSLPTSRRVVTLTFDGGANADGAGAILTTLAETGTPATFFLTGRFAIAYPRFSAVMGERYPVGNHTMTHPDLTTVDDDEVRAEVTSAHETIAAATGRNPRPWFRFPYGARDQHAIDLVNDLGYGAVRWTVDTLGWQGTSGGMTAEEVTDRVMGTLQPGQVVLLHLGSNPQDGSTLDADALPEIIRRVRAAGYEFIHLDTMLGG